MSFSQIQGNLPGASVMEENIFDAESPPAKRFRRLRPTAPEIEIKDDSSTKGRERRAASIKAQSNIERWLEKKSEEASRVQSTADGAYFSLGISQMQLRGEQVIGREKEIRQILSMALVPNGARPLLIGPPGIGKFSIILKAAYKLGTAYLSCPYRGIDCLNSHSLEDDEDESVYDKLKDALNCSYATTAPHILCIKNIDILIRKLSPNSEKVDDSSLGFLDNTYPFIATMNGNADDANVIERVNLLRKYRFYPIEIKESPLEEVEAIVYKMLNEQQQRFFQIERDTIPFAVRLAEKYIRHVPFPGKAVQMITECGNRNMLKCLEKGDAVSSLSIIRSDLAELIEERTGIQANELVNALAFNPKFFEEKMFEKIVGQDQAIRPLSHSVTAYKFGIQDKGKPPGVFLFYGPTGVGKTELAKQLSLFLFGKDSLIRIDGAEFQESHSISRLIGAPPGYEGHETGGHLTEALLKRPYAVVLVDEFEKVHPEVRKIFLHVLDEGRLTDGRGRTVDCSKSFFIMTTNLGADLLINGKKENVDDEVKELLIQHLSPELFNRFQAVVPFNALQDDHVPKIIEVQLGEIRERLKDPAQILFQWDKSLVEHFAKSIQFDRSMGMRNLCRSVDREVEKSLVQFLQERYPFRGKLLMTVQDGKIQIRSKKLLDS